MKTLLLLLPIWLLAFDIDSTIQQIKQHEGFSAKMYNDRGHKSIGYGFNLSYLTKAEAHLLLVHRLSIRHERLKQFTWFKRLSGVRKKVILNMSYQLGMRGLLKFRHMIWAIKHGYWNGAANQMINSRWYRQSGNRARTLVKQMRTGKH
jgi:lysozyme